MACEKDQTPFDYGTVKLFFDSDIGTVRWASILDGISYMILVGVAMPIKYLADIPTAVRWPGLIHGAIWVFLCFNLFLVLVRNKLSFKWCLIVFLCALVPLAPFFLDRKLKALDRSRSN